MGTSSNGTASTGVGGGLGQSGDVDAGAVEWTRGYVIAGNRNTAGIRTEVCGRHAALG